MTSRNSEAVPSPVTQALDTSIIELQKSDQTESSLIVTGWLTSAVHDEHPLHTLRDIYRSLCNTGAESMLDALSVLPILLPCANDAADDILSLVSECTSAKEVIIACQEAMEHLHVVLDDYDSEGSQSTMLSPALQLNRLVSVYAATILRLTLRRKSPVDTLESIFAELDETLRLVATHHSVLTDIRSLACSLGHLLVNSATWCKAKSSSEADANSCLARLRASYENAVIYVAPLLQANLAQRRFADTYPRLSQRLTLEPGWQDGQDALTQLVDVSDVLDQPAQQSARDPAIVILICLGSSPQRAKESRPSLARLTPVILACLQSNMALDATLAYLLSELTSPTKSTMDPEATYNLAYTIALVSASHSDATMRLIAFRTLALCLPLLPAPQQLLLLSELLAPSAETPAQLRVAAVGLARDMVIQALTDSSLNLLATPQTLNALSLLLFNTAQFSNVDPKDVEAFLESAEPKRLTECLSFYYVVWARDTSNRTGIRDTDNVRNMERSFFAPLRGLLTAINANTIAGKHEHAYTLAGLQIGIERIADALSTS